MRWARVAALMILLVLGRVGSAAEGEPGQSKLGEFVPAAAPEPAPAVSFADSDGNPVGLSDFSGKLVLVNLWATWCAPCLREMPSLERMHSRLGEGIVIVAISEDRGGSKIVEPFIAKLGLKSVKIYLDPKSAVGQAFHVEGLPTSLVIDREGRLLGRVEGAAEWDSPKILAILQGFLGGDAVVNASTRERP
jgi:thiol-disulfide isomerase/thioredoxin